MTIEQWIKLFEEAYKLPIRDDITIDKWERRIFTDEEKSFLLAKYTKEFVDSHQKHFLDIVQIFTRFFFLKTVNGETFCSTEKIKSQFGMTLEQRYGLSSGPFINLARTYWTFKLELDEDQLRHKENMPLLLVILRTVEMNMAGVFFPTPSPFTVSTDERKSSQIQVLQEFAPQIDIRRFLSENPILSSKRSGCLGLILFFIIMVVTSVTLMVVLIN